MTEKSRSSRKSRRAADPLSTLEVIDRLEVGPVRVEENRLVAPYRLWRNGKTDSTELSCTYQEAVFDPQEPESRNLAAMIAAQVAVNYGLFCRRIVFRGPYDTADRTFIARAAENTAREIYVKKLLEPNPFLVGRQFPWKARKRDRYLRSKIEFRDPPPSHAGLSWSGSGKRCLVLCSGGKDSLLTFGLMRELGREVHPIFVNESGRHWFTALNAFRHFERHVPKTARVWTNSDRVFSWMLKHLPFVRPDFAEVRSDEYPIRLWTVAVFLFAVLPLIRKRGIGQLLVGDEYDTTDRSVFQRIPHYNGLYDQSRYFDNAMSRYFRRKRWQLVQFSVLRPLSELLILKILTERYPELQALQVSCHSSHKDGDRMRPCGKCEKCRRIVAVLTALEADPGGCGYDREQVESCLRSFSSRGVHQEKVAVEHLASLLAAKGVEPPAGIRPRRRAEVMSLRFDGERSPLNTMPVDHRKGLYTIYLNHAEGAMRRVGRRWQKFDPLSNASLMQPYPFEAKSGSLEQNSGGEKAYLLGLLTWPEASRRFREVDVALLPVGAIEQHGPHLPLDTDSFDAEYLARQVALGCTRPHPLVLPLIPYGVSYHHDDFSGTISIGNETLSRLVYEIGTSAARHGITKLVIINGHGGNGPALNFAAQMINRDAHIFVCVDSGETSDADIYALAETPNDVHAGEIETSTAMALRPELVNREEVRKFVPRFSSRYLDFTSRHGVSWYAYTRRISPEGIMGDPTRASSEKGRRMWKIMIEHLVAFVEDLKRLTLDEIYQRRY